MAQALGRVVDSAALDACSEPRGKHTIEVPEAWIGAQIVVAFPARITCARCDGGGCDGCHRRGGHRLEGEPAARLVHVTLPASIRGAVVLRLVDPFGNGVALTQLHLETRIGPQPSPGVDLLALAAPPRPSSTAIERPYEHKQLNVFAWAIAIFTVIAVIVLVATLR